ncbi:GntR family transcriptional regulator [Streptomyces sp. DSM 41527]|uniref:GntR family transcriptional regulator n=1 Tax=Streptomyces mooreae TaxID=3075523 RepID=A0ABU2T879_9ACTN|nr:GntR family transcriptional regulator [Streptomyces sp. DSM 41527]MDT0456860.1 GntR family transcriptional regulator [Streptomyces sp. DSM 41527]
MAVAYERIAGQLRQAVRAGRWKPGDRLPPEAELAEEFGRSVPAVRVALRFLCEEGLIEKQHGRGNVVRRPRIVAARTNLSHQWEKSRAREPLEERARTGGTERDTGLHADDLVFQASYREREADEDLARAFALPQGTPLLERRYRTRYAAESAPFSLVTSYLVRAMVAKNPDLLDETKEPWPGGSQAQLYTLGIELGRVEERVTARPPAPEEAAELELPPGTSVLVLRKTSIDVNDRVVGVSDVILPGDRTEMLFVTPLERW